MPPFRHYSPSIFLKMKGYSIHRVTSLYPGPKPPRYWFDAGEPCLQEYLRRTGAAILLRSGAVGYDLIIAVKIAVALVDLFRGEGVTFLVKKIT